MLKFLQNRRKEDDFETLVGLLVDGKGFRKDGADFRLLCSAFKTGRRELDDMLYDAVGMSGDDVLAYLRHRKPIIAD